MCQKAVEIQELCVPVEWVGPYLVTKSNRVDIGYIENTRNGKYKAIPNVKMGTTYDDPEQARQAVEIALGIRKVK